mmetsp:Transcript_12990/g.35958  ORF Transcript_12990/g.35958 Transcript_12990/m.35958 type:complete len:85 (-) Transcript_12990:122-376(-)
MRHSGSQKCVWMNLRRMLQFLRFRNFSEFFRLYLLFFALILLRGNESNTDKQKFRTFLFQLSKTILKRAVQRSVSSMRHCLVNS